MAVVLPCVCVCVLSDPQSSRARKLCVTMEPALLLKGDIMVRMRLSFESYQHIGLHFNPSIVYTKKKLNLS